MSLEPYRHWWRRSMAHPDSGLSAAAVAVCYALWEHMADGRLCFPSQATLAARSRRGLRTVRRVLDELSAEGGWLKRSKVGRKYAYEPIIPDGKSVERLAKRTAHGRFKTPANQPHVATGTPANVTAIAANGDINSGQTAPLTSTRTNQGTREALSVWEEHKIRVSALSRVAETIWPRENDRAHDWIDGFQRHLSLGSPLTPKQLPHLERLEAQADPGKSRMDALAERSQRDRERRRLEREAVMRERGDPFRSLRKVA